MRTAAHLVFSTVTAGLVATALATVARPLGAQQLIASARDDGAALAGVPQAIRNAARVQPGEQLLSRSAAGRAGGVTELILERAGGPNFVGEPVWPVQARLVVIAEHPSESFVAEMYGVANDRGQAQLTGLIEHGWRSGWEVHVDAPMDRSSTLSITLVPPGGR